MIFFNFDSILFILSLFINFNFLTIAFILWFLKKGNRLSNRILSIGLITLAFMNILLVLYTTDFYKIFPHLMRLHGPLMFIIPLIPYFYFKAVLSQNNIFKKQNLLHLIPFFLMIIWNVPFYLSNSQHKIYWFEHELYTKHHFFSALIYIQFIIYFGLIVNTYFSVKKQLSIEEHKSESFKWIKEFLIIVSLILLFEFIPLFLLPFNFNPLLYIPIISSILFYALVYKATIKPSVFIKLEQLVENVTKDTNNKNYSLNEKYSKDLIDRINSSLKHKSYFFTPGLTLQDYAHCLKVPEHHISLILK